MDYFQCNILFVGSLFKLVLLPAQPVSFLHLHLCISIQSELESTGQSNFLFSHCGFLYMGISRVLMSDLTFVWLPKQGSQLPKWITSFLSPPSQQCQCRLGVAISSDLPFSCFSLRQDLSLTKRSRWCWAVQINGPTSRAAWIFTVL